MSTIQQLLTEHLDIWTAADTAKKTGRGRSSSNANKVYGIKKLRELILELAVRGKLVPQDPDDEPASELLKRMQKEKAKLVAEGKIKKEKPLTPISDEEKPFELPKGWEWLRLGDIYTFEYGENLPADKRSNSGEYPVYGSNGIVGSHNTCFVDSSCIVIGRKGSAGALNLSLAKGCCVTDVAYYCIPPKYLDLTFSFKLFHTLKLDVLGKGIKPGLSRNEAYVLLIAIPPFTEQRRIVAKIDELMTICDQLETQHNNTAEIHKKLVSHFLGALMQSQSAEEFNKNWQRIATHFDILFTTESSIDVLKQTLLQLAVMGKLVPQDPNDEPASELLKRILKEKTKLIAEGKTKKEKPLSLISEKEKLFELPTGWEWLRLGDIYSFEYGDNLPADKRSSSGEYPVYGSNGIVGSHNTCFIDAPCIVIGRKGSAGALNLSLAKGCCVTDVAYYCIPSKYLDLIFSFKLFHTLKLDVLGKGIKPGLSRNEAYVLLIAIPPFSEQRRIVTKIDELMLLCDQLNSYITKKNKLQQKIANVLVEQTLLI